MPGFAHLAKRCNAMRPMGAIAAGERDEQPHHAGMLFVLVSGQYFEEQRVPENMPTNNLPIRNACTQESEP